MTHVNFLHLFQAGTGDEFLDELLSNDASLDDGAVPDIKVIDSSINMTGNEVRDNLTFFKIHYPQFFDCAYNYNMLHSQN